MSSNLTDEEKSFAYGALAKPQQETLQKYPISPEEMSFAEASLSAPVKKEGEIPWYKSIPAAFGKGIIKGTQSLSEFIKELAVGDIFERDISKIGIPEEQKKKIEETIKPRSPDEMKEFEKTLSEKFPHKGGFAEQVSEKTGEMLPFVLGGEGGIPGKLLRSGVAATASEGVKELGGGKGAQTIAEILAFSAPDLSRRLVGATGRQQQMIELGRGMGMTEEQLVPAVQEETAFRRWLSRYAYKGASTQERLRESREGVGEILNTLRDSPEAAQRISRENLIQLMPEYANEYFNLPPTLRRQLERPFQDLMRSPGRGEDFIRFFQHVNYETTDPRRIQGFQNVTREAVDRISPGLGEDFRLANEMYRNNLQLQSRLPEPRIDMLSLTKGLSALFGIFTGNYTMLKSAIGLLGGRKLATEFLLNPRLQNLERKTINAINNNQFALAKKTFDLMREDLKDESPEFYDLTKDINFEEIFKSPKSKGSKEQPKTK